MERALLILKSNPLKWHFVYVLTSYSKGGVITYVVKHDGDKNSKTYTKDEVENFKYQMS